MKEIMVIMTTNVCQTRWCNILVFPVSSGVSVKWARWSSLTVWEGNTLKRSLKNLGWHHQVHILFVEQYTLCIEFQLKSWVNKSNTRTHTNLCTYTHTQTHVCVCVYCPHRRKQRRTHMATQRAQLVMKDLVMWLGVWTRLIVRGYNGLTLCHWLYLHRLHFFSTWFRQ